MKKIVCFFISFSMILTSISASYQFDFFSLDPIHKEYFADPNRPDLSVNLQFFVDGLPDQVVQDKGAATGRDVNVYTIDDISENMMMQVNVGETFSFLRNTISFNHWLSPVEFDFSVQGVLQNFYTEGFGDSIAYDGKYFFGFTGRVADMVSLRVGYHHYCSHYGDRVIKLALQNDSDNDFSISYKFIRMNDIAIGLSIDPTSWLRVYGELKYPPRSVQVFHPDMFAPSWREDSSSLYPDSYNARIVNMGFELNYPIFESLGNTTFGYDLHMYEDGKVEYDSVDDSHVSFNEDGSWDIEHNLRVAQDVNEVLSVELFYHDGRSSIGNFFNNKCKYFGFAFRVGSNS